MAVARLSGRPGGVSAETGETSRPPSGLPLAARTYFFCQAVIRASQTLVSKIGRVLSAAYVGLFLGFIDTRENLNAVTKTQYSRDGIRYLDDDFNRSGLKYWERGVVDRYFANLGSVIVSSSGGGREVLALALRGLRVSAFECEEKFVRFSRALLAKARVQANVVVAAPEEVPSLGLHDGIIVGWGSYMHIPGSKARIEFLRRLRAQVVTGGPVLVSCELRKPEGRRSRVIATIANGIRRLRGSRSRLEVGDDLQGYYKHVFTEEELRRELSEAGFRLEWCSEKSYGHAVGFAV